jgi:hypothetical protein
MRNRSVWGFGAAIAAFLAGPAFASTLSPPGPYIASVNAAAGDGEFNPNLTGVLGASTTWPPEDEQSIISSNANGSISLAPFLKATAHVSNANNPFGVLLGLAVATDELDYQIEIVPTNDSQIGVTIPVHMAGEATSTIAGVAGDPGDPLGEANSYTSLSISSPFIDYYSIDQNGSYFISQNISLPVGQILTVSMGAQAYVAQATDTISVAIDPVFTLPAPYDNEYTILFSPGILNTAAAPEPATWTMMLLGLAGLGLAGRRASRRGPPAAA